MASLQNNCNSAAKNQQEGFVGEIGRRTGRGGLCPTFA